MEVVDVRSSSNDLSSAPNSDVEGPYSGSHSLNPNTIHQLSSKHNSSPLSVTPVPATEIVPPKTRRPRKKKDTDAITTTVEKKDKPARKPRSDKGLSVAARKKLKAESIEQKSSIQNIPHATDVSAVHSNQASPFVATSAPTPEAAKYSQNGFSNNVPAMSPQNSTPTPYNATPPQPPASRPRAMFDPVRGHTTERSNEPFQPAKPLIQSTLTAPLQNSYFQTSSPSISSIINPPDISTKKSTSQPVTQVEEPASKPTSIVDVIKTDNSAAMDVDGPISQSEQKVVSEAPAAKLAAKPRAKEQPPPLPAGSGLLSSSLFGGDSGMDSKQDNGEKGPNIVLHIDLKNPENKIINFARMAEQKYGFAALYPRQAAQKERLARVAAAGAALERSASGTKVGTSAGDSGDEDVSVDIDRDSDNDGDVAMSGLNGTGEAVNSGTDGPAPKRRKRKDEYDADDPFVDDSEMLWEAQAAASKDGFFVYCGPLVPEGEKPSVERADGTVKRGRGRGRGGGPGSRGGRVSTAAAAARDADSATGRGGGPGSRGGGITRKPRITKAERQQQKELEKKQREQVTVLAAKPLAPQS